LKTCGREPCFEEVCFETTGVCTYRPIDCDDGNPCTDDVCDQSSGNCVFLPKYCSDGNRCTTDTCDTVTGACQYHPVDCDDGDACTTDTCAPLAGCQHTSIAGCSPQVEWVDVPAGSFQMGADGWETDEQPVHGVTVPAFRMARTETTVAQYARCVEAGGCTVPVPKTPYVPYLCTYGVPGFERRPVNCLDWVQASAFCGWAGGRLPTEAEWEYAARGGTTGDAYGPLDDIAAWGGIALSPDGPWIVASRQPNAFGIYDTVGNLMEYVADCWHSSYASAPSDGGAWIEGCTKLPVVKVIRDRAWSVESALAMRVSTRTDVNEGDTSDVYGFRCAADAPTP
jgi:formylglycine-generating enzyme required for sulfatase activity